MMSFSLSGGVEVYGFIAPTDIVDTYPVIDPLYGIDGFRNVNSLSELDLIPVPRRRAGMVVGVNGGSEYYKLNSSPWNNTITDWTLLDFTSFTGGTGSCINDLYIENLHSCSGEISLFNDITPNNDDTINLGTQLKRFRDINTVSGTTSYWTSTVKVITPELDLGNDSLGNPRIINADNSIIQNDILNGGNF